MKAKTRTASLSLPAWAAAVVLAIISLVVILPR
jgi:hypothetical protein